MRILFQTRTNLYSAPGGDLVQMQKTKEYLEKLGAKVDISLEFEPDLSNYDIVHLFNLMEPQDIYRQYKNAKKQNKKIVLSTIYGLYTEYERKARGGLFQKVANFLSPYQISYIKTIVRHYHENRMHKGVIQMMLKGHYNLMKEIVTGVDYLLPNSDNEMRRIAKEFNLKDYNYFNTPNAIDINVFNDNVELTQEDLDKYGQYKGCVLCAARLEGRKSTLNLVRAMKDLPYQLVLVGNESKNQAEYVRQIHQEAGENVHFLGPVPHADLAKLYKLANVHCLISWMETPGLSTLEAAAMDCNIVITKKGDTEEYFEDYAFYCEPDNVADIANAIQKAYTAQLNPNLKKKINSKYNWEETAKATYLAYQNSLS
ncbi:glycosyltransferase family 4 protein [Faecalibacter bovis]|uniref:Glycosyltransferase family 4 protein n=1 Tax=Faecalibacter bovis TaxID=2898187 RepID=A0ABX7XFL3_9FLAO|nr:glycosyltransferase family 4 protein [Faecalibacter bovis]MBS7332674.1 glycosyltransferase family 4 protein [Weeksellaceae bacterium]QTV06690.1 glycosyltransferase family 4 protein [Faecalibacter bovis]